MKQSPCAQNCDRRSDTCHSHCKEYKEWGKEHAEEKKRIERSKRLFPTAHSNKWRMY